MVLLDTGVLIDIAVGDTEARVTYQKILASVSMPMVTTWPCVAEAMHIIGSRGGGWSRQRKLSRLILGPLIVIYDIQTSRFSTFVCSDGTVPGPSNGFS